MHIWCVFWLMYLGVSKLVRPLEPFSLEHPHYMLRIWSLTPLSLLKYLFKKTWKLLNRHWFMNKPRMLFTHFALPTELLSAVAVKFTFDCAAAYTRIVVDSFDCRFLCRVLPKSCSWALCKEWADRREILVHPNSGIAEKVPCDSYYWTWSSSEWCNG